MYSNLPEQLHCLRYRQHPIWHLLKETSTARTSFVFSGFSIFYSLFLQFLLCVNVEFYTVLWCVCILALGLRLVVLRHCCLQESPRSPANSKMCERQLVVLAQGCRDI